MQPKSTYNTGIDECILKVGIASQKLLLQESSIADIFEQCNVDAVRRRGVFEGDRLERHPCRCLRPPS